MCLPQQSLSLSFSPPARYVLLSCCYQHTFATILLQPTPLIRTSLGLEEDVFMVGLCIHAKHLLSSRVLFGSLRLNRSCNQSVLMYYKWSPLYYFPLLEIEKDGRKAGGRTWVFLTYTSACNGVTGVTEMLFFFSSSCNHFQDSFSYYFPLC